jgi:hypothetical protein
MRNPLSMKMFAGQEKLIGGAKLNYRWIIVNKCYFLQSCHVHLQSCHVHIRRSSVQINKYRSLHCKKKNVDFFLSFEGYLGFFAAFQKLKISKFECVYSTMCRGTPNNILRNPDYENADVEIYCEGVQCFELA